MSEHGALSPIRILNAAAAETLSDITLRFPPRVLSAAAPDAERFHEGHPELYNGLMVVPEGAFRVIRHIPSNTNILAFAKNPHWLRGNYDAHGHIRPINDTLLGIYAVAAYRNISSTTLSAAAYQNTVAVNRGIYWGRHISAFRDQMRTLSHMHLSLYGADISTHGHGPAADCSILGNASQGYAFWGTGKGGFRLVNDVNDKAGEAFTHIGNERKFTQSLMSTSQTLGDFSSKEDLGRALLQHWSEQADKKWYGLNSVSLRSAMAQPLRMTKKTARGIAEWIKEEGWKAFAASGLLGVAGHFVLGPAVLIYALEAIEHRAADEVLVKAYDRMARRRMKKLGPEDQVPVSPGVDIRDHFLKRDVGNFVRACPELSEHFARDVRFLQSHEARINYDSGFTFEGFGETYPYEWMLNYPSLGLNDVAFMPDSNSLCYHCLNGYTALHYFNPDHDTVTVYARMRPETMINDNLKAPRYVREKLDNDNRILKLTYKLNQSMDIGAATGKVDCTTAYISVDDMVKDMETLFDGTIPYASDRMISLDYIKKTFGPEPIPSLIPMDFPSLRAGAPSLVKA